MPRTRYQQLHTANNVLLATRIGQVALDIEKKAGSPVIYDDMWTIGQNLNPKATHQQISHALRLAYTSEFFDEYGFGFVPPGNGRAGSRVGYVLTHAGQPTTAIAPVAKTNLEDTTAKTLDHMRGESAHYEHLAKIHKGTKEGRDARKIQKLLDGAAVMIESALP